MIIQIWQGITLLSNAEAYQLWLKEKVLPRYQHAAGLQGVYLCREDNGGLVNFLLLTLWASREGLPQFVGPAGDVMTPTPEERKLLLAFESRARNFEVFQVSQPKKGR